MLSRLIRKIETKRLERDIDKFPRKYTVILVPGFFGKASALIPLRSELEKLFERHQIDAKVVIHSNGLLTGKLSEMTDALENMILGHIKTSEIIVIAHSFGGRVAAQTISNIAPKYPNKNFLLVTNATILGSRPV